MSDEVEPQQVGSTELLPDDLFQDRALTDDDDDRFDYGPIAVRLADLLTEASTPVNVALFGPWGSGKSSLSGLLAGEFDKRNKSIHDSVVREPDKSWSGRIGRSSAPALGPGLDRPRRSVAYVRYDAWKYGGNADSLRRNFISHAAQELGYTRSAGYRQFHQGLYEGRRRVDLLVVGRVKLITKLIAAAAAVFLLAACLLAVLVGLSGYASDKSFLHQIRDELPQYLGPAGLFAVLLAFVKVGFDASTVNVERSAPSDDDEFGAAFRGLLDLATVVESPLRGDAYLKRQRNWLRAARRKSLARREERQRRWAGESVEERASSSPVSGVERVIFFIDELDRCRRKDVVETLVSIRTFLDERKCVFVVAADRAVLEQALETSAQQETPVDAESPYYSTAGAFLDKIFQHQIGLPPLRGRTLFRYARRLVSINVERESLWNELSADRGLLDDVLYALLPSHVRSPRRIKVLLNNFATTARFAQARKVDWLANARALAKLTALQTEFPHFAADLYQEPRLPELLLMGDDELAKQSASIQELVKRHPLPPLDVPASEIARELVDAGSAAADSVVDGDEFINKKGGASANLEMRIRHGQMLRSFLQRTAEVGALRREFIYLEPAVEEFRLADSELGDQIESLAPDDPAEVVALLAQADRDAQRASVLLLADIAHDSAGRERQNVVTGLLAVLGHVGQVRGGVSPSDAELYSAAHRALNVFRQDGGDSALSNLPVDVLPPALSVALAVGDSDLETAIVGVPELWEDVSTASEVAALYEQLAPAARVGVATEIASEIPDNPALLLRTMSRIGSSGAEQLLRTSAITEAIHGVLHEYQSESSGSAKVLLGGLIGEGTRHGEPVASAALDLMMPLPGSESPALTAMLSKHWDDVTSDLEVSAAAGYALECWVASPLAEWESWAARAGQVVPAGKDDIVERLLGRLVTEFRSADETFQLQAPELIRRVLPVARDDAEQTWIPLLWEALTAEAPWAQTDPGTGHRLQVLALTLMDVGPEVAAAISERLVADVVAADWSVADRLVLLDSVRTIAPHVDLTKRAALLAVIPRVEKETPNEEASSLMLTTLHLQRGTNSSRVSARQARWAFGQPGQMGADVVAEWLDRDPSVADVNALALAPGGLRASSEASLVKWSERRTRKERTELARGLLLGTRNRHKWIKILKTQEIDEPKLAKALAKQLVTATSIPDRAAVVTNIYALRPTSVAATQTLADAAIELLHETAKPKGAKGNIAVVVRLLGLIGRKHGRQALLSQALATACRFHETRLKPIEQTRALDAGLTVPDDLKPSRPSRLRRASKAVADAAKKIT